MIPREYIPAVDAGHPGGAAQSGVLAGYPMVDVRATLIDGSYHDVDSSEMAFKIAGSMALKEAARKADPVLLEPIMAFEVVTPEELHGRRHGRPRPAGAAGSSASRAARQQPGDPGARCPCAELFGYATDLRSAHPGTRDATPMQFALVPGGARVRSRKEIVARVRGE